MRLVPKNLRNYLQTPTLIGCRFLTNPEATYRLLRLALLRSAKPCSLSRFLKNRQTFFAFNNFFIRIPQPSLQAAEAVSAEPCSLARLLKSHQTFSTLFAFNQPLIATRNFHYKPLKPFQRSLRLCTGFLRPVKLFEDFLCRLASRTPRRTAYS